MALFPVLQHGTRHGTRERHSPRNSSCGRTRRVPEIRGRLRAVSRPGRRFAHVPSSAKHLMGMLLELREQKNVPFRYIELAIVAVSKLNACHYCIAHHQPLLAVEGISPDGIERVLDYEDHPEFDAVDKLVVECTIQVTNSPQRIRDDMFKRLREHLSEAQIVELALRIALCGFFNRFNDALMID